MFSTIKALFGSGDDVVQALSQGALIIDVRTVQEFRGGHVAGSKNIPLNELANALQNLPKTKPIVFCCASGARSGAAVDLAKRQGFTCVNGGPWTKVNKLMAEKSQPE